MSKILFLKLHVRFQFYNNSLSYIIVLYTALNLSFISLFLVVMFVCNVYVKVKKKKKAGEAVLGLGKTHNEATDRIE